MNFDFVGLEAVAQQFFLHELRGHHQGVKFLIELQFFELIRIADPFERQQWVMIAGDKSAAREDTKRRSRAGANVPGENVVFVAPHAIEIVIVHHARDRHARFRDRF